MQSFLIHSEGLFIQEMIEDRENKTRYFQSYRFIFNADGSVSAVSPGNTVNGAYRVFKDDGRVELEMSFPNVGEFDELADDWYFISIDGNQIRFADGGDVLQLEKM